MIVQENLGKLVLEQQKFQSKSKPTKKQKCHMTELAPLKTRQFPLCASNLHLGNINPLHYFPPPVSLSWPCMVLHLSSPCTTAKADASITLGCINSSQNTLLLECKLRHTLSKFAHNTNWNTQPQLQIVFMGTLPRDAKTAPKEVRDNKKKKGLLTGTQSGR